MKVSFTSHVGCSLCGELRSAQWKILPDRSRLVRQVKVVKYWEALGARRLQLFRLRL